MKIKKLLQSKSRIFSSLVALIIISPVVLNPIQTLALSAAQQQVFNLGINYFNTETGTDNNTGNAGQCGAGTSGSTTPVTAGNGAPDGASFPNLDPTAMANAINTWINQQNPNSELKGLGSTIVADGKNSNVNPFLIVAIAHEESSLSDPGDFNVQHGNNSFGRAAGDGQPSFQGSRAWYLWTSVEASVDYTAPENQNASGGGDMGSYLRDEYADQIDGGNLVAMFLRYAPPGDGNNTTEYIANVQSWISDLVSLTSGGGGSTDTGTTTTTGTGSDTSTCSTGTSTTCTSNSGTASGPNSAILCEAEKYAGIYYQSGGGHGSYSTFRDGCPENSISSAVSSSSAGDPGPCATDCSGLVSVAVDAVYNQGFSWVVTNSGGIMSSDGATPSPDWKSIPIAQAQAGDIVTSNDGAGSTTPGTDGHVEIVDHVQGDTVYSFGSHFTGAQTGPAQLPSSAWNIGAWRYVGPGGSQ